MIDNFIDNFNNLPIITIISLLMILTVISLYIGLIYFLIIKPIIGKIKDYKLNHKSIVCYYYKVAEFNNSAPAIIMIKQFNNKKEINDYFKQSINIINNKSKFHKNYLVEYETKFKLVFHKPDNINIVLYEAFITDFNYRMIDDYVKHIIISKYDMEDS